MKVGWSWIGEYKFEIGKERELNDIGKWGEEEETNSVWIWMAALHFAGALNITPWERPISCPFPLSTFLYI